MKKARSIPTIKGDPDDPRLKPWPEGIEWSGKPDPKDPDWQKYRDVMRQRNREIAEFNARKQVEIGIFFGVWRDSGPSYFRCTVAERNNGRKFCLLAPGDDGLPGSGKCCTSGGWCDCDWTTIIDGYDDDRKILWVKGGRKAAQLLLEEKLQQRASEGNPVPPPQQELKKSPPKRKSFWRRLLGI